MSVSPTIPNAAWISFVALIAASGPLAAESITLRPVADTSLFVLNGGSNNFGANTTLVVGTTASGSTSRAVLRFDIAGNLPAQAIITSVQLNLVVTKANSAGVGSTFALHRLLQSWGEGNKTGNTGAPATAGEATWFHRFFPATVWGAPGAAAPVDFSADAGASANVDLPDTYTFGSSSNLVEDVQTWLGDPAGNFGWIVLSQSEGTALTSRRIASREDTANAPTLALDFIPPPRIAGASLQDTNLAFHFTVEAGYNYAVEYADVLPSTNWLVLTNFGAKIAGFEAGVTNAAQAAPARFYRLSRVPCNCR